MEILWRNGRNYDIVVYDRIWHDSRSLADVVNDSTIRNVREFVIDAQQRVDKPTRCTNSYNDLYFHCLALHVSGYHQPIIRSTIQ